LLSENIFHASDFLLVPNIPTTLSMMTYQKLEQFFEENKLDSEKLRPFFSMAERRKKLHRETINEHIDSRNVLKTVIPYVSDVEKMGQYRQPVGVFKAKSNIARTYNSLWKEVKGLL
jgi:cellulose biosynthesis protein BcsQ